jgi:hypothetical protein
MVSQSRDYKEALLNETREELQKADSKASILLAAAGIAMTALLSAVASNAWYPGKVHDHTARLLVWGALMLSVLATCALGAAVKPRLRTKSANKADLHYFGNVHEYWPSRWKVRNRRMLVQSHRETFGKALAKAATGENYDDRLDDQIWHLGHTAFRKYKYVSVGIGLFATALILATIALLLEKFKWV